MANAELALSIIAFAGTLTSITCYQPNKYMRPSTALKTGMFWAKSQAINRMHFVSKHMLIS